MRQAYNISQQYPPEYLTGPCEDHTYLLEYMAGTCDPTHPPEYMAGTCDPTHPPEYVTSAGDMLHTHLNI